MGNDMDKCVVCGGKGSVEYPLLPGSPTFCGTHHNPRDAGKYGCDFSGPDDFDEPFEDSDVIFGLEERLPTLLDKIADKLFRRKPPKLIMPIWTTRDGRDIWKEEDFTDNHLINIIYFLDKRIKEEKEDLESNVLEYIVNKRNQMVAIAARRGLDIQ
jgi:hypothetical protein